MIFTPLNQKHLIFHAEADLYHLKEIPVGLRLQHLRFKDTQRALRFWHMKNPTFSKLFGAHPSIGSHSLGVAFSHGSDKE